MKKSGFTLIELTIVVAIIAILFTLVVIPIMLDLEPPKTIRDCLDWDTVITTGVRTTVDGDIVPYTDTKRVCAEYGEPYPNPKHAEWAARQQEKASEERREESNVTIIR